MDLNPDEAIAAGWIKEKSLTARTLSRFLDYSLRHAERIIVLDRFMEQRIIDKGFPKEKLALIPPWSHNDSVAYDPAGRKAFRAAHGLADKYVVMYSGNHSLCHSLDTLLGAARKLAERSDVAFCFVGGGSEYDKVKAFAVKNKLENVVCLPYQPLNELAASLSAADLHVVVMGESFTGIVHPCKIYNILEIGSPVLYIGPTTSHVVDVVTKLDDQELVCSARHGDVETVANYIAEAAGQARGKRSQSAVRVAGSFSREVLLPQIVGLIETEAGRQRAENRGQKSEVRDQRSEVKEQKSEVRGQRSEVVTTQAPTGL
jgi:glycosyltransferase involved in cell wall biosynthesis